MPRDQGNDAFGGAPSPHDGPTDSLARLLRTTHNGHGPATAPAPGAARLLGLDALTLNMRARDGHLELLWCDPDKGLGADLDSLQYALGDGPTLETAQHGHSLHEPDVLATDPARWPLFLPAAARTPLRAVTTQPLRLGAALIGVLTGYRTTPGPLTPGQLHDLHHLAHSLLLLLLHSDQADTDETTGLRLYRADVHQATGFLATELNIPLEEALLRLRAHAAAQNQPMSDVAQAVLTRRLPPDTFKSTT
ncbi:ANTAR domain-containing protein [Streptomyces sp. SDr-06]|uniref:ANTAR domain-containing protein n=1 Tax=Streptomyces sp. SDr-06 TaxID=2267702 RepID=UPI000DEB4796|nr:ANTAR domain-containing protein [Streptomyces sp. SDr-06]RCH59636.1 ANTAR domain-containing protein [Streptomyces sp. SDr-06]